MKDHIDKLMRERIGMIERLAAAFLLEVGSAKASKYVLVEERSVDGLKTSWYFKEKDDTF